MRNRTESPLQITVYLNVVGKIWIPAVYARDVKKIDVTNYRNRMTDNSLSISEAIERCMAYDCGDFQNASIYDGEIVIGYRRENRYFEKRIEISKKTKSVKDWRANAKERRQFEMIEI